MLGIVAGAYVLDEQSRLQSFSQMTSLQDKNAILAERLLRWKVLPREQDREEPVGPKLEDGGGIATAATGATDLRTGWRHVVLEGPSDDQATSRSSAQSMTQSSSFDNACVEAFKEHPPLPLPNHGERLR